MKLATTKQQQHNRAVVNYFRCIIAKIFCNTDHCKLTSWHGLIETLLLHLQIRFFQTVSTSKVIRTLHLECLYLFLLLFWNLFETFWMNLDDYAVALLSPGFSIISWDTLCSHDLLLNPPKIVIDWCQSTLLSTVTSPWHWPNDHPVTNIKYFLVFFTLHLLITINGNFNHCYLFNGLWSLISKVLIIVVGTVCVPTILVDTVLIVSVRWLSPQLWLCSDTSSHLVHWSQWWPVTTVSQVSAPAVQTLDLCPPLSPSNMIT